MKRDEIMKNSHLDKLSGYRKTRSTVFSSYYYLIWKLKNIDDNLLRSDQAKTGVETLGLNEYPWSDDFFSQTIGHEHLEETKEIARKHGL